MTNKEKLSQLTYLELVAALYEADAIDARFYSRSELEDTAEMILDHGAEFNFDAIAFWSRVTNSEVLDKLSGCRSLAPILPLTVVGTIVGFYPTTMEAKVKVDQPNQLQSGEYVYIKIDKLIKYKEETGNEDDTGVGETGRSNSTNFALAPWVGGS